MKRLLYKKPQIHTIPPKCPRSGVTFHSEQKINKSEIVVLIAKLVLFDDKNLVECRNKM